MPTPRPSRIALLGLVAAAATAFLLAAGGSGGGNTVQVRGSWRGLVGGSEPEASIGQRAIVVLKAPSLAEQVAKAGGIASTNDERRWTAEAYAAQQQLVTTLAMNGIGLRPEYSFARVLNGFSAALDPRAIAILERSDLVAGVYPVRAAYPATVSSSILAERGYGAGTGHRPDVVLPGRDGRGVTIALLDTGVDRAQPSLRGRVREGVDVVGGSEGGVAAADPADPSALETHGTELAGLLVGAGGPAGLAGVATGASVLPIRVAGWQPDARGDYAVYARTDQIVAGLERAVDPNADGDAHDAARVALIGVAARFAGFADSPEARAVDGALALDTLVVAAAGNEGGAGPGFGSVASPGGAPGALTVGAVDGRASVERARVVVRRGLKVLLDRDVPLLGAVGPRQPLSLVPAEPRDAAGGVLTDFFDLRGFSVVAGKAAVVAAGDDPVAAVRRAADAGAAAVLVYGAELPPGGLGLSEDVRVPVVGVPAAPALAALAARDVGADAGISIGPARGLPNPGLDHVVSFSSRGLAFDGRVKPDLVAAGVGLATAEAGKTGDGGPRYATVNGTSAAAALVAGAAALLAQARPQLDAHSLKSLLVGSAAPLAGDPVTGQGAGKVDVGAAAAGELAAQPSSLALGAWTGPDWRATQTITVRNVSTRRLRVSLTARPEGGESEVLALRLEPSQLVLRQGASRTITLTAALAAAPTDDVGAGSIEVSADGGRALRIPWVIDYRPVQAPLLGDASISDPSFAPADSAPVRLTVQAGSVVRRGADVEIRPVSRLDVQLWSADGKGLGLLARVRDLLPGRYTFGLTGRDPDGAKLPAGRYRLRLVAWPTLPGKPSVKSLMFIVE